MAELRARLERASLVLLLASALFASGVAGWWALAGLAVLVGLSAGRLGSAGRPAGALKIAGDALVAAACAFAFVWTLYPVVAEDSLRRVAVPLAYALAALALAGLAGGPAWPPGRTLIPSALALLLLGAQLAEPGPRYALCV